MFGRNRGAYDGAVCYVSFDHDGADGKRLLAGWHYSTRQHRRHGEIPDRRLHLRDDGVYEYAQPHHQSWRDKHGEGNLNRIGATDG